MIFLAMPADGGDGASVFDEARWTAMVAAHAPFLRRAIGRLSGFGDHVDDVVQEAFVAAFRRARDLPADELLLRAWLFRAAKHQLLHHQRSFARRARKHDALSSAAPTSTSQPTEQNEAVRLVRTATLALPDDLRDAFVLVELEGLSVVDVATILTINENTLRSRLKKARAQFAASITALEVPR